MKSSDKMLKHLRILCLAAVAVCCAGVRADSIPSRLSLPPVWRVGAEMSPAYVLGTSDYLRSDNPLGRNVYNNLSGALRADFSFHPDTREGRLYPGLYQGLAVGLHTFSPSGLLGTPVSVCVYQGAPIAHINRRLSLGYEWKFGAAMGWKHEDRDDAAGNEVVSTSVTAQISLGLKLAYRLTGHWQLSAGVEATHFSNGNTSLPNNGVNTISASVGMAYVINPLGENRLPSPELAEEADRGGWLYDLMVYGAWRKRIVDVDASRQLCPGRFGVLGVQFAPMRKLNRRMAVGPALDVQWDEGAGLAPYWVDGTTDDNIRFVRPPFGKQLSVGVSAHAELTMPIFAVNAGLGYDLLCPRGDKRFYQSLALKTFVSRHAFLHVGYRLGNFKDPQNLMLGVGVRL